MTYTFLGTLRIPHSFVFERCTEAVGSTEVPTGMLWARGGRDLLWIDCLCTDRAVGGNVGLDIHFL